MLIELLRLKKG